ncbi:TD and POZ domain-containing protein 1-like [Aphidius gifuensis]|uniref:TD and POZ domain-containing protein 1-like n=1 Tax=Aphidius gifuensis TaxID=684658 RepID=UPI001CDC11DC|nr:TD and POZ domain-containing protein 1-like [Aphidius gifuensis]
MAVVFADCIKHIKSIEGPAITGMKTCEFTYEWTIKNFQRLHKDEIESPSFSSVYDDFNDKWILKYYPRDAQSVSTYISVGLQQLTPFDDTSPLLTKCKLSSAERFRWDRYLSKSELQNPQYIQNDELKLLCTITMYKKLTNNSHLISSIDAKQQLRVDWKKLLSSGKSADVTIRVGQKLFRAIKGILSVRSPVFAAMFDHEQFEEYKKNETKPL